MTVSATSPEVADLVPIKVRDQRWTGPAYAPVVCLGFELGVAPVLGRRQAKRIRPVDRLARAADHLLYGLVLSGTRPVTRE
jgi:hypothetical protein